MKNISDLTIKTYDKVASQYSDRYFSDLEDLPYIDQFLNLLPLNSSVLDIGSGPGQFSAQINKKGFRVTGIDLSDEMLSIAREKVPEVDFLKMDMQNLDFDSNSFDGLLSAYSLIHIPSNEVEGVLREFYRVIKPGGYLQIIVQQGESDQTVEEPFLPSEKMFFNFFQPKQLKKLLISADFEINSQEVVESLDVESVAEKNIYTTVRKKL